MFSHSEDLTASRERCSSAAALPLQLVDACGGLAQGGVAVVDRRETALVLGGLGEQLVQIGGLVLHFQRVYRIEPVAQTLQRLGVGVDALRLVSRRRAYVFELLYHGTQPCCHIAACGVAVGQMRQLALGLRECAEGTRLVHIEGVAQPRKRLHYGIGALQCGQLLLGACLLALFQIGRTKLLDRVAQPLLVLARRLGLVREAPVVVAGGGELLVQSAVFCQKPVVAGEDVEHAGAELLGGEHEVLVLRMYVDKARAYLPEGGELHGHIAHEGAALASRRDDAAYGAGRFEVEIGVGEELFQPVAFDVEGGFDDAVARRILNGGTLVLRAE